MTIKDTNILLKKVRKIEIKTKGLSNQIFAGAYHAAFKGRGMAFSEVRNYNYGDDVRTIDWNVTARFNEPYIKVFEEERELTLMLLIDVSASSYFGTKSEFKNEYIAEIAAVLAYSAIKNNDKVGVIFFSSHVEKYLPPKKGKSQILLIIRELLSLEANHKKTDLNAALAFFNATNHRSSIVFVLSDFVSEPYEKALQIAKKKHDIIGLHIYDAFEKTLPNLGLVQMKDLESLEIKWVDTKDEQLRNHYQKHFVSQLTENENTFKKLKVDFLSLHTEENYMKALKIMFKKRSKRK
jgi:uncharacterized protein (DUF58 family)